MVNMFEPIFSYENPIETFQEDMQKWCLNTLNEMENKPLKKHSYPTLYIEDSNPSKPQAASLQTQNLIETEDPNSQVSNIYYC